MGFVLDVDHQPNEHFRLVQMTPRGSGCSVTIGTGLAKMEPGSLQGLQLSVGDIEAAHTELTSRGVPVSAVQHHDGAGFVDGQGADYNSFIFFQDPDGNGWAIQQSPWSGRPRRRRPRSRSADRHHVASSNRE